MKAKKILLYTPLIEWYLQHGLRLTAVHELIEYELGMPFSWFVEEAANARREADKDLLKKQLGDVAKLKGDSFYGKMLWDHKKTVMMKRSYQCGIVVCQLSKLRMLEFYYDFLDKYFSRQDFELCYMDTDSFCLVISGDSLDEIVNRQL